MFINSNNTSIIPYIPSKTAMEFINSEVKKWLATPFVLYKQFSPSISKVIDLNLRPKIFNEKSYIDDCSISTKTDDRSLHERHGNHMFIEDLAIPSFLQHCSSSKIVARSQYETELLEDLRNFRNSPGCHTIKSPVVGSRAIELLTVKQAMKSKPILANLEKSIYKGFFLYLIPTTKKNEADEVARELFLNYISKYATYGCTEKNIVDWCYTGLPGGASNKTSICEVENECNTWRVTATVEARHGTYNENYNNYLPPHVVAYHELMHVEETPLKARKLIFSENGAELLTVIKSFILLDTIYKKIHDIDEATEVDYNKFIDIEGTRINLGKFANFYREQEIKLGKLYLALISDQSIEFLIGKSH